MAWFLECQPVAANASSLGRDPKLLSANSATNLSLYYIHFTERLETEENAWIVISTVVCLWPSVPQCSCVCLVVCVMSVLCPWGWCCIHLSVTQKQMSPGRWGAADCRGDRPMAGWRCLRPTVPSRWKLRSLSAALFISLPPTPTCPLSLTASPYCKDISD